MEMRGAIMSWAINKRLEKEREKGGDPMDVGTLGTEGGRNGNIGD